MSKKEEKMCEPNHIRVASFDIGKKNFSFYIEEFDKSDLEKIVELPKHLQYNEDGTPTEKMQNILDRICTNGTTILHKNSDLTKNCKDGKILDPETFHNMTDLLDSYEKYWNTCSYFIIEQQMSFGKKRNPTAVKLGQHCYSYFTIRYGRSKSVTEFPAYHKTQILGACKERGKLLKNGKYKWISVDKLSRKKWSVEKAEEILNNRDEGYVMDEIKEKKKRDDQADCLTMLQSWKYLMYVEKSYQN